MDQCIKLKPLHHVESLHILLHDTMWHNIKKIPLYIPRPRKQESSSFGGDDEVEGRERAQNGESDGESTRVCMRVRDSMHVCACVRV
jgi:hypothetical protein